MLCKKGQKFAGDMARVMLLETSLAAFLNRDLERHAATSSPPGNPTLDADPSNRHDFDLCFYLAQCPLSVSRQGTPHLVNGPLHALTADICLPSILSAVKLWQVSFWANTGSSISSLHYDPHCNLLCVVEGCKTLRLLSPGALKVLRAFPPYHDSANHAEDDLWEAEGRWEELAAAFGGREISLGHGDALFIPGDARALNLSPSSHHLYYMRTI